MADNATGLNVKSRDDEAVRSILVDSAGTNEASISAAGRISVDASGVTVPVSDAGGSITIDGSVSITGSLPAGTNNIGDVDVLTVIPGTGATNLGKAIDSASGGTDTGIAVLAVRDDALTTLTPADGDYVPLRVNDQGALHIVSTGGASGTEYTEGSTDATITGTAIMWEDTSDTLRPVSAASPLPMVQIGATPAGTNNIGDVDVLTVPAPLSTTGNGTAATSLRVTLANDSTGIVTLTGSLPAGTNNIGDVDVITLPNVTLATTTNTIEVVGDAAHDAVVAGNPLLLGAFASAAAPTSVSADGDAVRLWALRSGALATVLTAAGALIGGDATNGLDVDVTRMAPLVAGTANIGDVDVLTVPAPLSTTGNGTAATALRVTMASDSTGVVALTGSLPAGTNNIGDIDVLSVIPGTAATNLGKAIDSAAGATDTGIALLAVRDDALSTLTPVDGDYVPLRVNDQGALHIVSTGGASGTEYTEGATDATITGTAILWEDAADTLRPVNVTKALPARLSDGTAYYTNTGQTAGTAHFARITDATNTAAVIATINSLKADVSSVAGAVPSQTNPLPVRLTDGSAFYVSGSDAPTSPQVSTQSSTDVGAGSSVDLDFTAITGGTTGQLMGMDISSAVPVKVEIKTVNAGTPTTRAVLFFATGERIEWRPPYKTFITQAGGATSRFRATVTNMDQNEASNIYGTAYWDQI